MHSAFSRRFFEQRLQTALSLSSSVGVVGTGRLVLIVHSFVESLYDFLAVAPTS